jgi:CHASE3 domain sensor protein
LPQLFHARRVAVFVQFMSSSNGSLIFSRPAVFATLLVAFGLVATAVALSAFSTREIAAADQRASHAQLTLVTINQLLATVNEAETAQRGYILTPDDKYLSAYRMTASRFAEEIAVLRRQVAADAEHTALVNQVAGACDRRFAEMARTIELRREHGIAPALNVMESDESWQLASEVRQRLQLLQKHEIAEIAVYNAAASREAQMFQDVNRGVLAVAALLGAGVAWVLTRRLHHLEGLIKVCAWTRRVQWQGEWITFEDYLARRFNLHVTHGISEDAARQLSQEIESTPVPPEA